MWFSEIVIIYFQIQNNIRFFLLFGYFLRLFSVISLVSLGAIIL